MLVDEEYQVLDKLSLVFKEHKPPLSQEQINWILQQFMKRHYQGGE